MMKYYVLTCLLSLTSVSILRSASFIIEDELLELRESVRRAFLHSFRGYLKYAYPYDELMPLTCMPRKHDNRTRGDLDDVLGGYMLTLVESLDALLVFREFDLFRDAVELLRPVKFDRDIDVSVFEANIRMLGGLLSAHQLANKLLTDLEVASFDRSSKNSTRSTSSSSSSESGRSTERISFYDGRFLLDLAADLGRRLLPAFYTITGIPVHRVNLKHGFREGENAHTCTAAGTSFLLEMGLLSRLTGDPTFEYYAKRSLKAVWNRRSALNLVGSMIDINVGQWLPTGQHTGTGAGVDSFYETMLKSSILLGDDELYSWFETAYEAIEKQSEHEGFHLEVDMNLGKRSVYSYYISSLGAFWPALQVLSGHVTEAESTFHKYELLWNVFEALPDIYDMRTNGLLEYGRDYPLRPEMIESAYHLYTATGKQHYLEFAKRFFLSIERRLRTPCGYASIADVTTGALDDRMDSFFISETLKYLFLIFDEALPENKRGSVFCHGIASTAASSSSTTSVSVSVSAVNSTTVNNSSGKRYSTSERSSSKAGDVGAAAEINEDITDQTHCNCSCEMIAPSANSNNIDPVQYSFDLFSEVLQVDFDGVISAADESTASIATAEAEPLAGSIEPSVLLSGVTVEIFGSGATGVEIGPSSSPDIDINMKDIISDVAGDSDAGIIIRNDAVNDSEWDRSTGLMSGEERELGSEADTAVDVDSEYKNQSCGCTEICASRSQSNNRSQSPSRRSTITSTSNSNSIHNQNSASSSASSSSSAAADPTVVNLNTLAQSRCIKKQLSLFTTEGHVILIEPALRHSYGNNNIKHIPSNSQRTSSVVREKEAPTCKHKSQTDTHTRTRTETETRTRHDTDSVRHDHTTEDSHGTNKHPGHRQQRRRRQQRRAASSSRNNHGGGDSGEEQGSSSGVGDRTSKGPTI